MIGASFYYDIVLMRCHTVQFPGEKNPEKCIYYILNILSTGQLNSFIILIVCHVMKLLPLHHESDRDIAND